MHAVPLLCGALALSLAGCASVAPAPPVSLINSLSFDHPLSGARDGLRSSWPLATLAHTHEVFPLAQIRQCDAAGACAWGVLRAERSVGRVRQIEGGVALDLDLRIVVARSAQLTGPGQQAGMTIPADVAALAASRRVRREVTLPYGSVERIELDYGIRFELCAQRLDSARQPVEPCAIAYF